MDLGINGFLERIKEHYDKVIAFVVLLALLGSLALLWGKLNDMKRDEVKFEGWLEALRPFNPDAAQVDSAPYEAARHALESPLQLAVPGGEQPDLAWMFVPESRFNCRECRHPVAVGAEICPFCNTPVVLAVEPELDHDGDGMPTEWERQYGLDPFDPSDAHKDLDGDGWTNLEEFLDGTDPTDPKSRPSAVGRLKLEGITGTQFALRFNSRMTTASGPAFGLNYRLPNGEIRTQFVKIGDTVEGFKVEGYEPKEEAAKPPAMIKQDVSELTLLTPRGDTITLVKGQARQHIELVATLSLSLSGQEQRFEVRKGDPLEVDGGKYSVIDVDDRDRHVILKLEGADSVITIRQVPVDTAL